MADLCMRLFDGAQKGGFSVRNGLIEVSMYIALLAYFAVIARSPRPPSSVPSPPSGLRVPSLTHLEMFAEQRASSLSVTCLLFAQAGKRKRHLLCQDMS